MPSSGKSRRHRKNRPSDAKHKNSRNGSGGGSNNNGSINTVSSNNGDELHHQDTLDCPGKLVLGAMREEDGGPPLPADAMDVVTSPGSDVDDPAFNAFNYWKTPFPDVSIDVTME